MSYSIETPRLWLQPMTIEDHFEDWWELWKDPRSLTWSTKGVPENREEALANMAKSLPGGESLDTDKFAVLLRPIEENPQPWTNEKGKPKMIGMVGTNRWSAQGFETGYCMNLNYWGKKYATEAFGAFLKLYWTLPERQNIKGLVAKVDRRNIPSHKILVRAGGRPGEPIKEGYARFIDGGKKSDMECWHFDRPGVTPEEVAKSLEERSTS
ncbi:GNAT domain-containing protein [Tricladium varicosporioides]|nr:GNAT domain-containing protein [Hymenoscyphus varicosporioides]